MIRKKRAAVTRRRAAAKAAPAMMTGAGKVIWPEEILRCLKLCHKRPRVIVIRNGKAEPHSMKLKKGDRVLWRNEDLRGYKLRFEHDRWPFWEGPVDIPVPVLGVTGTYTVFWLQSPGVYDYTILGFDGPPDGPEVVVEP